MVHPNPRPAVRPSRHDEVAAAGSELIGGPAGRHAVPGNPRWPPVRVIALVMIGMFALGLAQKAPCATRGWFEGATTQYTHACYSDIPHLYTTRGFADGLVPYFHAIPSDTSTMEYLEYPVLTGIFMEAAAWLTPSAAFVERPAQYYWLINAALLLICAVVIAVCVSRTQRNRPWDGLMVALAPAFALTATINWDLLAGALTCAALLAWSRNRPLATGLLLGLATAAKLYPLLLLGPLLVLCWRAGRWRAFGRALTGTVIAWLAVNLPFILGAPEGWAKFYTFSRERPVDFGSFWLIIAQRTDLDLAPETVNPLATALTLLGCAAIGALAFTAPHRPRLAQLAFLVVAVFILTNKVYSPQYVLWLIPLAVLARPRWRDFLIWQCCEVIYFLGIWMYLAENAGAPGLPAGGYQLTIVAHLLGTLYLCVLVVRDVIYPEHDIVRRDGSDDPGGGPLDGAPDRFVLRRRGPRKTGPAPTPPDPSISRSLADGATVSRET
ncbi:glycosyltransferase family 87 protein [Streptomyces sp. SM14]|uniref:glycosyltransferase family 87 protein n=1 Tax=Streptomyces sp. SM14 TaxID=1736045 RepID=UPI000CD5B793|nr:glycosyltransferase 87 family protein [Streptomyces sp. SM14]